MRGQFPPRGTLLQGGKADQVLERALRILQHEGKANRWACLGEGGSLRRHVSWLRRAS